MDTRLVAVETTDESTYGKSYPIVLSDKSVSARKHSEFTIDYIFTYNAENMKIKKFNVLTCEESRKTSDHSPILAIIEI